MAALTARLQSLRSQPPEQWLGLVVRAAPGIVAALLVVALAAQLVQLTWALLGAGSQPAIPAPATMAAAQAPRSSVDIGAIANAHLFGVASEEPAVDLNAAPQTQMNLVLTGTMASSDPQQGFAIIGDSAATARTYPTGGMVRPGTKLHSVFPDRVILDTGGRLETLALPRDQASTATIAAQPAPMAASPSSIRETLRQAAESNPGAVTSVVRPQPVFANGAMRGYRVYPARNRRGFSRLGLQPGDLVTSINGTPLDDPSRGIEIFNTLDTAAQVTLVVERNGQQQSLTIDTTQLSNSIEPPSGDAADAGASAAVEAPSDP